MSRLHLLCAAAATALSVLSLSSSAHAEAPEVTGPPSAAAPAPAPEQAAPAPALPRPIMRVLGVLEVVGVAEIDRSSVLVSTTGAADTARLPVRAPTWLSLSPEVPRMPLLFSRVMQLKF